MADCTLVPEILEEEREERHNTKTGFHPGAACIEVIGAAAIFHQLTLHHQFRSLLSLSDRSLTRGSRGLIYGISRKKRVSIEPHRIGPSVSLNLTKKKLESKSPNKHHPTIPRIITNQTGLFFPSCRCRRNYCGPIIPMSSASMST